MSSKNQILSTQQEWIISLLSSIIVLHDNLEEMSRVIYHKLALKMKTRILKLYLSVKNQRKS